MMKKRHVVLMGRLPNLTVISYFNNIALLTSLKMQMALGIPDVLPFAIGLKRLQI